MDTLLNTFNEVKKLYFPRWDIRNEWKVVGQVEVSSQLGLCDLETKTIYINPGWIEKGGDDLIYLIAHEISHFVSPTHGKKWQTRFLKVADTADKLGQVNLANKIRAEVDELEMCRNTIILTAADLQAQVNDAVLDCPNAPFEAVIGFVADGCGVSPERLLRYYPSLHKTYIESQKWVQRFQRTQQRLREHLRNLGADVSEMKK